MARPTAASVKEEKLILETKIGMLLKQEEDYDTLIAQLQRLRDPVIAQRTAMEDRVKELDALQLPIHWLPNEILSRIFILVAQIEAYENAEDGDGQSLVAPVALSLVCRRWRNAAYSEPGVWTNLHFYNSKDIVRVKTYAARTGTLPLDVRLWHPQYVVGFSDPTSRMLASKIRACNDVLRPHSNRISRLTVGVGAPEGIVPVISFLRSGNVPMLEYLCLQITKDSALFSSSARAALITVEEPLGQEPVLPRLKHLRLEEVPIEALLGQHLLSNLVSLDLCFPPRKSIPHRLGGSTYYLKLSSLLRMLSATSRLEELTLTDTIPIFDVISPDDDRLDSASDLPVMRMPPVKLQHLKSIIWDSPTTGEAHWLLGFLYCPAVERLDIALEKASKRKSKDPFYRAFSSASRTGLGAIPFPSLRECVFQCPEDDTSTATLRKFFFPALEKFELINITIPPKSTNNGETPKLWPTLPRLESIFRDPRLFHLTHLTLSRYNFEKDHLRPEAVFGYMPVLTSLTVDSCLGVAFLIRVLEEVSTPLAFQTSPQRIHNTRMRRGVKVCPRLESLSFWRCDDLEYRVVVRIVRARRGDNSGPEESGDGMTDLRPPLGVTDGTGEDVTRTVSPASSPEGNRISFEQTMQNPGVMRRQIRPLRKSRQLASGGSNGALPNFPAGEHVEPSKNILSTIVAAQEAMHPAPIIYVGFHDCFLISETQATLLQAIEGVDDVVWAASEPSTSQSFTRARSSSYETDTE